MSFIRSRISRWKSIFTFFSCLAIEVNMTISGISKLCSLINLTFSYTSLVFPSKRIVLFWRSINFFVYWYNISESLVAMTILILNLSLSWSRRRASFFSFLLSKLMNGSSKRMSSGLLSRAVAICNNFFSLVDKLSYTCFI